MTKVKTKQLTKGEEALVDPIEEVAKAVLSLAPEDALVELLNNVNNVDYNYLKVGGVLSRIQEEKWWMEWGKISFNEFVTTSLAYKPRKALYLISIYNDLVDCGVPHTKFEGLPWTILKEISSVVTKENVDEWVKYAKTLTLLQLQETVAKHKAGTLDKSSVEAEPSTTVSMSFKVHTDQKETIEQALDKAKHEAGTEFPGVALEAICLHYLAGGKTKPAGLKATMKKAGFQEVLESFGQIWPDIDLEISLPPSEGITVSKQSGHSAAAEI